MEINFKREDKRREERGSGWPIDQVCQEIL